MSNQIAWFCELCPMSYSARLGQVRPQGGLFASSFTLHFPATLSCVNCGEFSPRVESDSALFSQSGSSPDIFVELLRLLSIVAGLEMPLAKT